MTQSNTAALQAFQDKLAGMTRGAWLHYHTGFLARDREGFHMVHQFASAVYEGYKEGRFILVQRRLGFQLYEYFAVRIGQ